MCRAEDTDTGTDANIVADDEIAPVDEALGANPDACAYFTKPVMASVQADLIADAGAGTDAESFGMAQGQCLADTHTIAERLHHGPQYDAPHPVSEIATALGELIEELLKRLGAASCPQVLRELDLECGVWLCLARPVGGADEAATGVQLSSFSARRG